MAGGTIRWPRDLVIIATADSTDNDSFVKVLGNKADAAAAGAPTSEDSIVAYIKQIINQTEGTTGITTWPAAADIGDGVSMAEGLRAVLTSMVGGDDFDAYTNISNGSIASIDAAFQAIATLWAADGANTFNPTIQGGARTDLETALNILATYLSPSAAAWSVQMNNQTARTNLEQTIEDLVAVLGVTTTTTWDTAMFGGAQATVKASFQGIGTAIGAEFDGTPDMYDVLYTGVDSSAITNDFDGGLMEVLKAGLEKDTGGAFDADTDSNEAISNNVGNPQARTNFKSIELMLGMPDAANSDLNDMINTGFDSSGVSANEDGSVLEVLNQIAEAVNKGTGAAIGANMSLIDVIGQDGTGTAQAGDRDAADIQSRIDAISLALGIVDAAGADGFEEDGTGGTLYSQINSSDANLNFFSGDGNTNYDDNLFSFLVEISKYVADGDGDFAAGTTLPSNVSLYDVTGAFSGDGGAAQDDSIKASLDLAHTDLDLILSQLSGAIGIAAFPAGAAAANDVSIAEVLRYVQDQLLNGGDIYDVLYTDAAGASITADVATANAALVTIDEYHDVPAADNVLNAQINEVIGNKTDAAAAGAVTGTDTLVGYIKQLVTAEIASTAVQTAGIPQTATVQTVDASVTPWTVAAHRLFTVTGTVKIFEIFAVVDETVVEGAGADNTCSVGTSDDVDLMIGVTVGDALVANDIWGAVAGGSLSKHLLLDNAESFIIKDTDIDIDVLGTNSIADGQLTYYCTWKPISVGATLVAAVWD